MDQEFLQPLTIPFKIFKKLGFYQTKDSSRRYRIYGFLLHLFTIEPMVVLLTIPLFGMKSILHLSDVLCITFTYFALSFKSLNLMIILDEILAEIEVARVLIIFMSEKQSKFGYIRARMKSVKRIFFIYYYSCLLTVNLSPLAMLIFKRGPPYTIPYIMWVPFDYEHNFFGFIVVMLIEYLSPLVYCGAVVSIDMLPIYFFNLSAGLLEELADRINAIDATFHYTKASEKFNEMMSFSDLKRQHDASLHNELKKCIEIHLRIRKFIANSQNIFSTMICVQAVISSVILCTTAYSISMVHNHACFLFAPLVEVLRVHFSNNFLFYLSLGITDR